ncbi:MDR family MFS transporter [Paenibacillus radicis (ex Xue et al. 2023)]|uniref:MFS transporter n=1 Tax=Paenibacillus radicis (ex Xue et al. 2023) TaxID=2972489 RepID=A0ABT1YKY9_9BACL|nr:MFS transporter [Paenibacillus radicis (ex Xue et al. 2023)]MCR8633380.1 MFS transporter [Paenibacillus radicis (ex Xue et al. 2023)]
MKNTAITYKFHPIVQYLFVGTAMSRIATSMTLPFLTVYMIKYSSMSSVEIGLTIGSASLASMLFGFFGGILSDKFGRVPVMKISLFVWSAVFFLFAWNPYTWIFVLLNLLNGLCKSAFEPVSVALISDLTPRESRFRAFSIRYTAANIGFAVGPLIGTACGISGGGLAFLITGCFYLVYGITFCLLLKAYRCKNSVSGLPDVQKDVSLGTAVKALACDRALLLFLSGGILVEFTYSQLSTLSAYVTEYFENGVWLYSCLLTVNALTVVGLQLPISNYLEKKSPLSTVKAGNLLYAAGGIGFAVAPNWWLMVLSMIVFSLGEILCFPAGNELMIRIAPTSLRGAYLGAQNCKELGRFMGPVIGMPILSHWGILPLFIVIGVLGFISTYCYWRGGAMKALN